MKGDPKEKKFDEFNALLKKAPKLQKQLKAAKDSESFVRLYCELAKQNGYDFSQEELRGYIKKMKNAASKHELHEEDLKRIAGGFMSFMVPGGC